jgi:hypothetical protein
MQLTRKVSKTRFEDILDFVQCNDKPVTVFRTPNGSINYSTAPRGVFDHDIIGVYTGAVTHKQL